MTEKAFQDYYPEDVAHCFGCGRLNEQGHRIRSFWDGEETVCRYTPDERYMAIPGYVYGGMVASLIDCHSTGTAAAAGYREEGRPMDSQPPLRYVTASLKVDYLRPTPLGVELEIRGRIEWVRGRKVLVSSTLSANSKVCARGEVLCAQMPESMLREK
jgi:acyl-coenzyme A thioesterase PaaI-like protein